MRFFLTFFLALAAHAQTATISDTLTAAVGGGNWTGRVTVSLNAPGSAQPLYSGTTSLAGWSATYCVGVTGSDCTATTAAGSIVATLYTNDAITPAGTSYSARFQPTRGPQWSETWTVSAGNTKLYQIRATIVPTPTTTFTAGQIALAAGRLLYGSASGVATSLAPGTNGHVLKLSAGYPVWAAESGGAADIQAGNTGGVVVSTDGSTTLLDVDTAFVMTNGGNNAPSANMTPSAGTWNLTALDALFLRTETSDPVACTVGEVYINTTGTPSLKLCTTTNNWTAIGGGGSGTVTSVSVTTANGISGTVANSTTTPAITLTLGAITPTSVAATGNVTGANLSGTNTGDQTNITGNAGTATALAANGTNCTSGEFAAGVDASGNAEGCTAAAAYPTQAGNAGKVLETNGTTVAWQPGVAVYRTVLTGDICNASPQTVYDFAANQLAVGDVVEIEAQFAKTGTTSGPGTNITIEGTSVSGSNAIGTGDTHAYSRVLARITSTSAARVIGLRQRANASVGSTYTAALSIDTTSATGFTVGAHATSCTGGDTVDASIVIKVIRNASR